MNKDPMRSENEGYFYQKEQPDWKRHAPRKKPNDQPKGGTFKGAKADHLRNLKVFFIVAAIMVLLLVIAVVIVKKGTQLKQSRQASRRPSAVLAKLDATGSAHSEATTKNKTDTDAGTPASGFGGDLNTDTLKKAVLLSKRAEALAQAGSINEAVMRYQDALRLWPQLSEAWAALGHLYLVQQMYESAELTLGKAVQQNPSDPAALNDLGLVYYYQRDASRARDMFEASIEINPGYADAYYNLAHVQMDQNELSAARSNIETFLQYKPADPSGLKDLAFFSAQSKEYAQAVQQLQKAIAGAPDWPALYFDASAVCALMGDVDGAFSYLEKASGLSGPAVVYQVYMQPAFSSLRETAMGIDFEKYLAEQARLLLEQSLQNAGKGRELE